jgi:hypothetical protein
VFCDISHRLGGITPFGVFSDAFPGLNMWVTFACATAKLLTHFIISIAVLENVPPSACLCILLQNTSRQNKMLYKTAKFISCRNVRLKSLIVDF